MAKKKSRLKVIAVDTLGVLLILVSPITGLIPGPGGIPVFLAGIGLLSINHEWARRLLLYLKTKGAQFFHRIFADYPILKLLYDVVGVGLMFWATWIIIKSTSNFTQALAVIAGFAGLGLFIGNRQRLNRLTAYFHNRFRNKHK